MATFAQSQTPGQRLEIPVVDVKRPYQVVSANEEGLYIYNYMQGAMGGSLAVVHVDTALNMRWNGTVPVTATTILEGSAVDNDQIYFLFRNPNFIGFEIYVINSDSNMFVRHPVMNIVPFKPIVFQVLGDVALIAGYYNRVPVVVHFEFKTNKSKILPGLFNETGELTQIRPYPDGTFDVVISSKNYRRERTLWIKTYDRAGALIRNLALDTEDNKNLIFGRAFRTEQYAEVVAGVYGNRNSEYVRGIFIASLDPLGNQQMRYFSFGDLENFFSYMKAKREERMKRRIARKKVKGRKIRLNYRFLVHELIPHNGQFILLGEAFYPRYRSVERPGGSPFFYVVGSSAGNQLIFDGYRYTHAVVLGFDEQGRLLWDNSFEINDVKTFELEQFVKLQIEEDYLALLYLFSNEIRTKLIQGNKVLEGKTLKSIQTVREGDRLIEQNSAINTLEYWYGKYFYAHGVQQIDRMMGDGTRRKEQVFFINKVTYKK